MRLLPNSVCWLTFAKIQLFNGKNSTIQWISLASDLRARLVVYREKCVECFFCKHTRIVESLIAIQSADRLHVLSLQ